MRSETSSQTLTEAETTAKASHWDIVTSHSLVTQAVLCHAYAGSGTEEDPYAVEFIPNDPRNPMGFSMFKKWSLTLMVAFATLAVAFVSSAYSGGVEQIIAQFHVGDEVVTLGIRCDYSHEAYRKASSNNSKKFVCHGFCRRASSLGSSV